jgi:hypothetical protein
MPWSRWSQPANDLADGLRKLNTEKAENGDDDQEDDATYEFGAPVDLTRPAAIETTEDRIAIHLEGHAYGNDNEGDNHRPNEVNEEISRLQRVGTDGEKHQKKTNQRVRSQICQLGKDVREKMDRTADQKFLGLASDGLSSNLDLFCLSAIESKPAPQDACKIPCFFCFAGIVSRLTPMILEHAFYTVREAIEILQRADLILKASF